MVAGLDEEILEPALIQMTGAGAAVMLMISTHVSTQQPMHVRRNRSIGIRPHDDMYVIRHEAIRKERQLDVGLSFGHQAQQGPVIFPFAEDSLAIVPARKHVLNDTGRTAASSPWHWRFR